VYGCYSFQLLKDGTKSVIDFFSVPQSVSGEYRNKNITTCSLIKRCEISKHIQIRQHHFSAIQLSVSFIGKVWTLKPIAEPIIFEKSTICEDKEVSLKTKVELFCQVCQT
jgi:hypothetical protein